MVHYRLHLTFLLLVAWAAVLVGRLFFLQVYDYGTFAAFARGQQQVDQDISPERGSVVGHTNSGERVLLATNRNWPYLYVVPKDIVDAEKTWNFLRELLSIDDARAQDIKALLENREDPHERIAEELSEEQAKRIEDSQLPGLHIGRERGRFYPFGSRLSHVIGFVGFDENNNRGGVYGLEAYFDKGLRGVAGKIRGERDGQGTILTAFSRGVSSAAQPGVTLHITVDPNIQYQAEKFLREAVETWKGSGGSVIVMEPKTGAVRALANVPTFDLNLYGDVSDAGIFTNAALTPYEPGSVFKPITMSAAIDSGAVTPDTIYENTGSISIGSYTISNTLQQYNGKRSMIDVLRYSLNTGAVFAQQRTGQERFRSYAEAFGFGKPTGITLPFEAAGSVENLKSGRAINYATASFGQGISVTPLQLVYAIGAIANGGVLMRPFIVEALEYPNGSRETTEPEAVRRVIEQKTATRVAAIMTRVVEDGSGVRAAIPGYSIAGKTGTAEIPNVGIPGYGSGNIHSFVGFFPAFDPRYVILTKVDRPQGARYAEATAVPLFRNLAEYLITYAAIPPDKPLSQKSILMTK